MHVIRSIIIVVFLILAAFTGVQGGSAPDGQSSPAKQPQQADGLCEHGVKKGICTRCNPNLSAVFKAKGDWCAEHTRPESQCVICHPDLAEKGVK